MSQHVVHYKTSKDFCGDWKLKPSNPSNQTLTTPSSRPPKKIIPERTVTMEAKYTTLDYANSGDPEVWGPAFWFSLHNGASRYPIKASPFWAERMKNFILGIPVMLPCEQCSDHATAYLDANYDNLNEIVSGRENLFMFFVNFHNYVNQRYGKPQISLDDARRLYEGKVRVTKLQYKAVNT